MTEQTTMTHYKLALLGFGNVGQAFARLLQGKREELLARYGISCSITGVYTARHGSAIAAAGLDLKHALELIGSGLSLNELSTSPLPLDGMEFVRSCQADVLFETTPVNYETGQPAVDYLITALERGMHAITANKGPVVHAYRQLTQLAKSRQRKFYFESAVMDGAPVFSLFREALPAVRLLAFEGILNSTTNLILCRMEQGESFERAVAYAQSIGISETDPSGDIDGWDAAVKVAALATVLMDMPLKPAEIERQCIRGITPIEIERARRVGKRWKLVCSARLARGGVQACVTPQMVSPDSPLYHVNGTSSLVQFETDVLGKLTLLEDDPGPQTTAYGLLADLLNAVKERA